MSYDGIYRSIAATDPMAERPSEAVRYAEFSADPQRLGEPEPTTGPLSPDLSFEALRRLRARLVRKFH